MSSVFSPKLSVVLNDDVLQLVFSHLSVKQLFRLETTSEQFRRCVDYALKQKTGLRLGKKFQNMKCFHEKHSTRGGSINKSAPIKCNQYDITIEVEKGLKRLGTILRRCPNLKTLYLSQCYLNEEVFQLIVDNCKHLECLTLCGTFISNDMEDWERLAQVIARLNLKHLQVVGQFLYFKEGDNSSYITDFSSRINYLVSLCPALEQLTLYWYYSPMEELIKCLPTTIKTLHLIRCARLKENDLAFFNSGNFPNLKELKLDTNFFGRGFETQIFQSITKNLCLDRFEFYSDRRIDTIHYSMPLQLKKLKMKAYENEVWNCFPLRKMECLVSLEMVNPVLNPEDLNHLLQSLPNLQDLTLRNYRFSCICYTSVLVDKCCGNCSITSMKSISKLPNLKRLRLFSISAHQLRGLKNFPKLSFLELTVPSFDYELISSLSKACIEICLARGLKPFTVRSDEKFIQNLKSFIVRHYEKVPNNLWLFVKEYRLKRIHYY